MRFRSLSKPLGGFAVGAAALALFASGLGGAGSAAAQSGDLSAAIRAGVVGERFDGYMGYAAAPDVSVRKQVQAINIKRRSLYIGLAARRRVTAEVAGIATGCELLSKIGVGEAYMLSDGVWRRRAGGEPAPSPSHCGDR